MHLDITNEYFSDLISQLSLPDEKKVIRKTFTSAHQLLYRFFDLNYLFIMGFLICLVSLMVVTVLLYVQINQNMDHITDLEEVIMF